MQHESGQMDLFRKTHEQQFDAWVHTEHGGQVANKFIRYAIGIKRKRDPQTGKPMFATFGAKAIVERLRWHYTMLHGTRGSEAYLCNNNYTAYLARFAMRRCKELEGFFRTRKTGSDNKPRRAVVIPIQEAS